MFRTGGDEFAALLYLPQDTYEKVKDTLQERISKWRGTRISEISISVGYVPRWEVPDMTLEQIIQEADRRMYAVKQEYYNASDRHKR